MTTTLAAAEATISKAIEATGYDPATLMLLATLQHQDCEVRPKLHAGGHTWIYLPSGERLSLSALLQRVRRAAISAHQCASCNALIPASSYARRRRGGRIDRAYCSNRCRQRAWRQRCRAAKVLAS